MTTIRAIGNLIAALLIAGAGFALCMWMHAPGERARALPVRPGGLDSLFATERGGLARDAGASRRLLQPADTAGALAPDTRVIYRTRTDTVEVCLSAPEGFKTAGLLGPRPVSRAADGGFTLTYFEPAARRYQQDTYAPPPEPRWALAAELGGSYTRNLQGAGVLGADAVLSLRRDRTSLHAGARVLTLAGGEVHAGPTLGVRWRPFAFRF